MTHPTTEMPASAVLIAALRDPACYPHAVEKVDIVQTHISWIVLTGSFAYKIKKPVDLGFLDFTTLAARKRFCETELALNRRFAPALYEAVVGIGGGVDHPRVGGGGEVIEYAVRMREFPQSALASRLLANRELSGAHIDALAARIAAFHAQAGVAAAGSAYGAAEAVIGAARENFAQLAQLLPDAADQEPLAALRTWTDDEYHARENLFAARQEQGRVRECHGDLHLGNIVLLDGALTPFDCIEFDPALRWIDVMSEAAFLVMDCMDRGRPDFAFRFLNGYLEASGDYAGLALLRFYLVYRALVRAKVHALRAAQTTQSEHTRLTAASRDYIALADRCAHERRGALVLMRGLSGSGKSVLAQAFAERLGAIRVRSDVERKRLAGLAPRADSGSPLGGGIYTSDLTCATYHRLCDLARACVSAGYTAIVDATSLARWQRDLFRREAVSLAVPFVIVDVTAPEATLRSRIEARIAAGHDASEAGTPVLERQLASRQALAHDEMPAVLTINTERADREAMLNAACEALHARLATMFRL